MLAVKFEDRMDMAVQMLQAGMTYCILGLMCFDYLHIILCVLGASLCAALLVMVGRDGDTLPPVVKTGAFK